MGICKGNSKIIAWNRWLPAPSPPCTAATTTMDRLGECHPHAVEVVHLGHRAVTVCHDCQADSGFVPERQAETLARQHLEQTLGEASVPLSAAVA